MASKSNIASGIFTGIAVVMLILLIGFGAAWVNDYIHSTRLPAGSCQVESNFYNETTVPCRCGDFCKGEFPCIHVFVTVRETILPDWTAILYDSENVYNAFGGGSKCSYVPDECDKDYRVNERAAGEYLSKYGKSKLTYECYYNLLNQNEVLRTQAPTTLRDKVIHSMFWPAFVLVLSCIIALVIYRCGD